MGTHKHGLPTSLDDEVLVGLIQLTKRRSNFTDAKVQFSRYELIELLGWPQSGQSYRRIEEALAPLGRRPADVRERLVGQRGEELGRRELPRPGQRDPLRPRAAADVVEVEAGQGGRRSAAKADKTPLPLSSFRWNEVIFQSFQSGNLKQLDLEFYLKLRLPTTKRMFRFLDKRFYRRARLDFALQDAGL